MPEHQPLINLQSPQNAAPTKASSLLAEEITYAKRQLAHEFPEFDRLSQQLQTAQQEWHDPNNILTAEESEDLQAKIATLEEKQQKWLAADPNVAALVHEIEHLEQKHQKAGQITLLNKLDRYDELVGTSTFDAVQDASLISTLAQNASHFIYAVPIIGAVVLSAVELVNVLKATAFDTETQNRRAVKIASGLAIAGLTIAAAALILNPVGLVLTAAAYTVKVARDGFLTHKADKDFKKTSIELGLLQKELAHAENHAYESISELRAVITQIGVLRDEQTAIMKKLSDLRAQKPTNKTDIEAYETGIKDCEKELGNTRQALATQLDQRNALIQNQRPDIVRMALKVHRLTDEAKEFAQQRHEKYNDFKIGVAVAIGATFTVFGGPLAIAGVAILAAAATTAVALKSNTFSSGLSRLWQAVTGTKPSASPAAMPHDDHVDYIHKNTVQMGHVKTLDLKAPDQHLANHYHASPASPALHDAVRDLITTTDSHTPGLVTKQANPNSSSHIVDKLRESAALEVARTPTKAATASPIANATAIPNPTAPPTLTRR